MIQILKGIKDRKLLLELIELITNLEGLDKSFLENLNNLRND